MISVVDGVSFTHTGTLATSLTTLVTALHSAWFLPTFEPMSSRSMWGQEKFSSNPSAPSSWQALASTCQCSSSLSFPEPAIIDAISILPGCAFLIFEIRGTHQSSGLSEINSQFHEETKVDDGRFNIERREESWLARMNLVFGPFTLITGCSPIVLVTTPPHPHSKARRILLSDSVGGAEASKNGFSKLSPVNFTERFIAICTSWERTRLACFSLLSTV